MKPTQAQLIALFHDSVFLSDALRSIHLVRIDERSKNLVILAGESILVEITQNGRRQIQ